ncbi:MAG: hypothetical protein IMZ61_10855 [Planctomycetes bacterium]|nr:hypothetical protein [Planctomycetota bacterium]
MDSSFGSHRLPVDPPLELDGKPAALAAWRHLVGPNHALRELDYDIALDYCIMAEELQELEQMKAFCPPNSDQFWALDLRIDEKREFRHKLWLEMHPDAPGDAR